MFWILLILLLVSRALFVVRGQEAAAGQLPWAAQCNAQLGCSTRVYQRRMQQL